METIKNQKFGGERPLFGVHDVRLEDIDRLDSQAGLERVTIFSPDGPADYMRTRLNWMSDETFAHFLAYQKVVSERPDLIGAGSHVVDVVRA